MLIIPELKSDSLAFSSGAKLIQTEVLNGFSHSVRLFFLNRLCANEVPPKMKGGLACVSRAMRKPKPKFQFGLFFPWRFSIAFQNAF